MDKTLNIKLDESKQTITNLNEILEAIKDIENDINSNEYLETLLNYLEYQNISNKDALVEAIKAKLLEFKAKNDEQLSAKAALKQAQEYNEDLKRINIISTSKYNNDSKKDIEYISFTHDDGTTEVLVCAGDSSIGEYIAEHANDVATKSAEEIFKYFKETVHQKLNFYKESEFEKLNPNLSSTALVREEDAKALEVEEVEKYAQEQGIESEVQITVDPNGERIYLIGDAIIKFHNDFQNNRVMDIIQEPKINHKNTYTDLMNELDNDQSSNNIFPENEELARATESIPAESIDFERVFPEFDINRLKSLLIQKEVYGEELSSDNLSYINESISFLIGSMVERAENDELYSDEELTLKDYMSEIVEKYQAIESGSMDPEELSETDKKLAQEYLNNLEKIKALGLKKQPKKLELKNDENNNSGIALGLIIVEMLVIAAFVMLFLSIDI